MITKYALINIFVFLRNALEKESVRSLARKLKISPSTSKKSLDYLFEKEILKKEVIGNVYQYYLNNENILTRQLKITCSIAELNEVNLVKEIIESYPSVSSIVLFGSVAKGYDTSKSDIDLLVLSSKPLEIRPLKAENKLKRELPIVKYTFSQWREKALLDPVFYQKVIIDGICLYGELPMVK
ncbi:MAG TPA: nucleotidyltransferase domain-containing protein [Candidatus Nanoarchaeia archaeon]|nr:nucleotidyltransferase domain-containing protein [Candidatus Nanoarchaeia archaeon]